MIQLLQARVQTHVALEHSLVHETPAAQLAGECLFGRM